MRELASQYGGQEGAMKVLLQFVNKLATVEGINDDLVQQDSFYLTLPQKLINVV
jgi:hypothetical protein